MLETELNTQGKGPGNSRGADATGSGATLTSADASATATREPGASNEASDARSAEVKHMCLLQQQLFTSLENDSYSGPGNVLGILPDWMRGTFYRAGPGLWEVGQRQLRHTFDGFLVIGAVRLGGPRTEAMSAVAMQQFLDDESYRAARGPQGKLVLDKLFSRRPFESWGNWATGRLRVTGLNYSLLCLSINYLLSVQKIASRSDHAH